MASNLEQKSIKIIEISGKAKDWKIRLWKFLAKANYEGYQKVLTGTNEISSEKKFDLAVGESNEDEKKTVRLWHLNKRTNGEILLYINGQAKQGNIAFNLVVNCTTTE